MNVRLYYGLVEDVLGRISQLEDYASLHLTSIAKAIELYNFKINKIVFQELKGKGLIHGPGILLTQELEMVGYDNQEFTTFDHFIFYDTTKAEDFKIRFTIAHELGHVFLHNPMDKAEDERIFMPLKGYEHLFAVEYSPDDEVEADIFALIMCEQRKVFRQNQDSFRFPCVNFVKACIAKKYTDGSFRDYIEKLKGCIDYKPVSTS